MKIRLWAELIAAGLPMRGGVYYIGGNDVLPPPLKGIEEQEALERMENGDEEAKRRLIEHNLRLVVFIARRFENTGVNLEDLISIGTIGLIKAISTYRLDRNIKLATYGLLSTSGYIYAFASSKVLEPQGFFVFIILNILPKNT